MKIGYTLSSEDHDPQSLVDQARRAAEVGFEALWISDHFHPWNDAQGHSPFVWSVIGGVSQVCDLPLTTGVTCPTVRIHPAIIAQAAATSSLLLGGRFNLGVGSGEALNEHILGDHWPEADKRLDMLEESIEVMRTLWQGGVQHHEGRHYKVWHARVYDLPEEPPPVLVSAFGPKATRLAAKVGDGFVTTAPDKDAIELYRSEGGKGPVHAGTKVCYAPTREEAVDTVYRLWPNMGLPGELAQILPTPRHFEQASDLVDKEKLGQTLPCGPDLDHHVEKLEEYREAGIDELYIHPIGDVDLFFREAAPELLKRLR